MLHKHRIPHIFLGRGELSVKDGSLLFSDKERASQIPVGQFTNIFLEPGCSVTHAAVALCAEHGCQLNWVGESGVRLYATGITKVARTDRLWLQAEKALNKNKRLSIARAMYAFRFQVGSSLTSYTLEQLSGLEAGRVKDTYRKLAEEVGIIWEGRSFEMVGGSLKNRTNLCVSTANSCLYGVSHAAIQAAGYSPSIGFIHGRTALSFVYDVADLVKFQTVTRIAFEVAADTRVVDPAKEVRGRCRDIFKEGAFVAKLIKVVDSILGYNSKTEVEGPAILAPFEFWPYANRLINKSTP
jgi:CRISPR-associated protein Cas1